MWNFIIPILFLFGSLFATIFWSGDLVNNGLVECFRNANITLAICIAFMGGAVGAGIMGVSTKLFSVTKAFDTFVNGMAELISVPFILVCAWSLGSIVKGMGTSEFLIHIVENYLTPGLVPALVFLFGSAHFLFNRLSWGVWSIMMPIAFPMAVALIFPFRLWLARSSAAVCSATSVPPSPIPPYSPPPVPPAIHVVHVMTSALRNHGWYFGVPGIPFRRPDGTIYLEHCGYRCYSGSGSVCADPAYQAALPGESALTALPLEQEAFYEKD